MDKSTKHSCVQALGNTVEEGLERLYQGVCCQILFPSNTNSYASKVSPTQLLNKEDSYKTEWEKALALYKELQAT